MNKWILRSGLAALTVLATASAPTAEKPTQTGSVVLTLFEGIAPADPSERETRDMDLELTLRDGKFEKPAWGYAINFNKADHDGEVITVDGEQLTVKLTVNRDKWYPASAGEAQYQIALKREGDAYTGQYTGTFSFPGGDGPVKRDVKGKVAGRVYPLWTEPLAGFKKLEPNEHPRLIFRKSDLPTLKQRMETPEGKAIMERFMTQLPKQSATHDKNKPFFPAGYGLAWQLTGDKAHADKAKELLAGMLGLGGSQDIHFGPEAQAIAVTLDLCYDAWDAEFRQTVIDNLAKRVANLNTLTGMGGASLSPWHNHEGVRAGSLGVAAICLWGEKTGDGKEIPGLNRMIHALARGTRRYFQFSGTSHTGYCLEGSFYKRMTWNSGPGNMIQAYRTAFGGDLLAGWPGHWAMLGEWIGQPPSDKVVTAEGLGDDQSSGLWPIGLVTVPDSMKAGARWLFDRSYGLDGNKTFGVFWAYHAGYVLMNYPFDVAPRPPSESLPWVAPDPAGGHWIFRKPWQDGRDSLVVFHLCSELFGGCHHERSGRIWDMQLFALGRQWVGPRTLTEEPGVGAALPTAGIPGALNSVLGPKTLYWNASPDGRAVLSLDMEPVYMQALAKGAAPAAGQKTARFRRFGTFIDHGIRANRYVGLDLSGACGAPVLFVSADRTRGAADFVWNLELAKEAGAVKVDANTVVVGDPAGANMRVFFVPMPDLILTYGAQVSGKPAVQPEVPANVPEIFRDRMKKAEIQGDPNKIQARGCSEYFVLITVQNGAAPALKVEGEGLAAKVTIGARTIRLAGDRIELGDTK